MNPNSSAATPNVIAVLRPDAGALLLPCPPCAFGGATAGLATAGGYVYDSQLAADTDVYRISFAAAPVAVPAPPAVALVALGAVGLAGVRRLRRAV